MSNRIGGLFAVAGFVTVAALAHHNMTALFDFNDRVTLNGTFTKVDWRNPHIYLEVEVKDSKGKTETWQIEGPSPSFFRSRDIGKMDFEGAIGKMVTAEASRARDKSHSGLMRVITLPGGKLVSACPTELLKAAWGQIRNRAQVNNAPVNNLRLQGEEAEMKSFFNVAIVITSAAITAALLLAQAPAKLDEKAKAAKARQNKEAFENNARVLTLFDRDGRALSTVGARDVYNQPVLSPDRTRIATIKVDFETETQDLFVMDIATGKLTQITHGQAREGTLGPAWSPDGRQVAYIALRNGTQGVYRSPSNGEGPEELLYKVPGQLNLTDWSQDGRYICVFSSQLGGSSIYAIPTEGQGERKAIEVLHSAYTLSGPRLSPDSRYVSYMSNQSGKNEMYVSEFDVSRAATAGEESGQRQISDQGGQGMGFWRRDGRQFYYLAADRGFMAVEVSTSPQLEFGKPKLLFRPAPGVVVAPGTTNVSRDGERFLIAVPPPQLRQLTILDRQGKVVSKIGEPGEYGGLSLSHDGTRVVTGRNDPKTGNVDIWVYDLSTGKGTAITSDTWPKGNPVWSRDDKQIAYVSSHDNQQHWGIYRKASDRTGAEELLFQYTPGAFIGLTDWSEDGKFLTFSTGVLLVVPLDQGRAVGVDRKAIEWLRDEYGDFDGHFSPDTRWLAYGSDELGVNQVGLYVRPFDASKPEGPGAGPAVEVTGGNGIKGMIKWRRDGKELYYLDTDDNVTAVEVSTTPSFRAGTPKVLFKRPGPQSGGIGEGDRFVFLIPAR